MFSESFSHDLAVVLTTLVAVVFGWYLVRIMRQVRQQRDALDWRNYRNKPQKILGEMRHSLHAATPPGVVARFIWKVNPTIFLIGSKPDGFFIVLKSDKALIANFMPVEARRLVKDFDLDSWEHSGKALHSFYRSLDPCPVAHLDKQFRTVDELVEYMASLLTL